MTNDFQALVLNADCRPLSYFPLSLWSWQDAIKAVFQRRVSVLAEYDEVARSPSFTMRFPSVILLHTYVDVNRHVLFSRYNLMQRDHFQCCYCGSAKDLTFDHVVPRSRNGPMTFENIVAACSDCNTRKANRTPEEAGMVLRRKPYAPTVSQLQEIGRSHPPPHVHNTWIDFLYWDSVLEDA